MAIWIGFIALIFAFLALDLGVFHKKAQAESTSKALLWTGFWISMALLFSVFVYFAYTNGWVANPEGLSGQEAVILYITGFLVEKSLSLDNIFVIALIFTYFMVPKQYQHRVLFWGIVGALFFRGIMIGVGAVLIQRFEWMIYVFGALLMYSAYKMWRSGGDEDINPNKNPLLRLLGRYYPVLKQFKGERFFVRLPTKGRKVWAVTPLFVALIVVETTDIVFAVDSIPAIFAITKDPFIVFTSNIFAILGLRSLYFVLASLLEKFRYLKYSLIFILFFVGVKILLSDVYHLPPLISLGVIFAALTAGVAVSLINAKRAESREEEG
ncbi:MAG: TerC family protein [Saprospiraceae bacterium]|nr:TerC family protein [Saprospiraceae bacterium]